MRILLIHNSYQSPGGEDFAFDADRKLLLEKGHHVRIFQVSNKDLQHKNKFIASIEAIFSFRMLKTITALIREFKPDIAHFHNTFMVVSPSAYYACSKMNIPVVQSLHNYRVQCPAATLWRNGAICESCVRVNNPLPAIMYRCWRKSRLQTSVMALVIFVHTILRTWATKVDCYIALTQFAKSKLSRSLPAEKIIVKQNFLFEPNQCHTEILQNSHGEYALFIGRLSIEKGLLTLLRAFTELPKIPKVIIGDGPLRAQIEIQIKNQLIKRVCYEGWLQRSEVQQYMKSAKFLIMPSEWFEGFPLTIIEAYAARLPVIASRLGAMAEIVKDGKTGLLFTPGDAQDLAEKVQWAWDHPEEMAEMGRAARREYEERYTPERNYEMLMEIYQKAIEHHQNRRIRKN